MPSENRRNRFIALALLTCCPTLNAANKSLQSEGPAPGYSFDNGQELPGVKGRLARASDSHANQPALSLSSDFTGGGKYVQASVAVGVDATAISFFVLNSAMAVEA